MEMKMACHNFRCSFPRICRKFWNEHQIFESINFQLDLGKNDFKHTNASDNTKILNKLKKISEFRDIQRIARESKKS